VSIEPKIKYEGFCGRPLVDGGPGAQAPWVPLKSDPAQYGVWVLIVNKKAK